MVWFEQVGGIGMKKIFFTEFKTSFDWMYLAASDKGVVKMSFGKDSNHSFFSWLEDHFPDHMYEKNDTRTKKYVKKIEAYLKGSTKQLDIPVDLHVSGFQRKVLLALMKVPYGKIVTYGELAFKAGNPRASRAAGTACGRNPLPFVIPCHRVVAAGGKLGGYGGGERLKRKLLENEGITGLKD
jgi:O-6-methylguanine DNA methyltransferase